MATVTVDPNTDLQTISRWEATGETGLLGSLTEGQNWQDDALDACVDLGINGLRCEIRSGWVENTTDYFGLYEADGRDFASNPHATTMMDNRAIPVDVNPGSFKMSWIDWQIDNFVTPLKTKLAARGETLFWSLCYVHFSASNQLHINSPAEYGEMIEAIDAHIIATYGSGYRPAYEIFLEPDNTAAATSAEIAAMIAAARDAIVTAGRTKPYFIAPSTTTSPACLAFYQGIETANATAFGYIDEVSRHRYGTQPDDSSLGTLAAAVIADGKVLSQLEAGAGIASGGNSLAGIHQDLKVGKVSAWQQFTLAYISWDTSDNGNQYFLIGTGPGYTITEGDLTKYLRHYFYAIRANAVRKDASIAGTGSGNGDPLAFRNTNGTYAVVVKCSGAVTFDIAGLPNGTYEVRYTTGNGTSAPSVSWQSLSDQVVSGGNTGNIAMPGAGVITIYDQNYLVQPTSGSFQIGGGPLLIGGKHLLF